MIYRVRTDYSQDFSSFRYVAKDSLGDDDATYKSLYDNARKKFDKSQKPGSAVLFTQIKASHFGYVNNNNTMYDHMTADFSAKSFTAPHNKPIILNHNTYNVEDTIGRVVQASYVPFLLSDAQMKNKKVPNGVVVAHGYVSDPAAMEKVLDKRFMTVSISGTAEDATCGICGGTPLTGDCDHYKHEVYDGKTCYYILHNLAYNEVSFVTTPADSGKSHFAGVTNYEIVFPNEEMAKDEQYIVKNMLSSKESATICDNSGVTLFLAQDSNGNVPRGKAVFVFSSSDAHESAGLINKSWAKDLHVQHESGLILPLHVTESEDSAEDSVAALPPKTEEPKQSTDRTDEINKSRKESAMELAKVSVTEALDGIPALNLYVEDLASKKAAEAKKTADAATAILTSKDEEIKKLQTSFDELVISAKNLALDSMMTLMAQLEKPQYVSVINDNKDSQEKLESALKAVRDRYAARDLKSLQDTVADLKLELDLKKAADAQAAEAAAKAAADAANAAPKQDQIPATPALTGIDKTVTPKGEQVNNAKDSANPNTAELNPIFD